MARLGRNKLSRPLPRGWSVQPSTPDPYHEGGLYNRLLQTLTCTRVVCTTVYSDPYQEGGLYNRLLRPLPRGCLHSCLCSDKNIACRSLDYQSVVECPRVNESQYKKEYFCRYVSGFTFDCERRTPDAQTSCVENGNCGIIFVATGNGCELGSVKVVTSGQYKTIVEATNYGMAELFKCDDHCMGNSKTEKSGLRTDIIVVIAVLSSVAGILMIAMLIYCSRKRSMLCFKKTHVLYVTTQPVEESQMKNYYANIVNDNMAYENIEIPAPENLPSQMNTDEEEHEYMDLTDEPIYLEQVEEYVTPDLNATGFDSTEPLEESVTPDFNLTGFHSTDPVEDNVTADFNSH
ncbi:hypothetical protein Btru_074475 [Bulinus truncatus]|nr:hypothetical protein Btru_074475 [Bulinus truncatus]